MADLDIFVENRESIGHAFGLQSYADVMTHFATAERYLNRCWSASSDGYTDEVNTYLARAKDQFTQALELLRSTHGPERQPPVMKPTPVRDLRTHEVLFVDTGDTLWAVVSSH